jgi:glycosyltransferase involved in cell wall biosynthesis
MTGVSPLVTCIMPTADRRSFVPWAISDFLKQDYPSKELVIVDDGADGIADLVPDDPRITYIRLDRRQTIGSKRNIACERASGAVIAHWDDDDWHAPCRLSVQVRELIERRASIVGLRAPLYYEPSTGRAWQYVYSGMRPWLAGNSLCYTHEAWRSTRFADIDVGEDSRFVSQAARGRLAAIADETIHVGIVHDHNVSPKRTGSSPWRPLVTGRIASIMGADVDRFVGPGIAVAVATGRDAPVYPSERRLPVLTVAKRDDLEMPEFRAYRDAGDLPWMRRWELPFVLSHARLMDTMAVLDCSINPAGLEQRLRALYPDLSYRRVSPVGPTGLVPLLGMPDAGYDRVICINTLEHLPRAERRRLVCDMATKLRPGGLLLLTSDFYFDGSWEDVAFLRAGVMRADRSEFIGGYNKVTFDDWLELCTAAGLEAVDDTRDPEPDQVDDSLYLNRPPHPHAALGGVFRKPAVVAPLAASRRIVLALLSWNTRDVTVESVEAYVREARMLVRMGHEPLICVCDNGSDDGVAAALRTLESGLDIEHRFIMNDRNRGNSIARNQVIDQALAWNADYLMFMDGDIEVVPFSSFAMLRRMESQGSRLGCLGAHSWGQTNDRRKASRSLFAIDPASVRTTDVVAWTQYGLFRMDVFRAGVRFDERSPFDGAGWGFEDNDLAFQMDVNGFTNQYFTGMTYLHRDARSSIRVMRARGIDAAALYDARKRYVIDKWAGIPRIANGPLVDVRRASMP